MTTQSPDATEQVERLPYNRQPDLVRTVDDAIREVKGLTVRTPTAGIDAAKLAIAAVMSSWTDRDMRVADRTFPTGTITVVDVLDHAARAAIKAMKG